MSAELDPTTPFVRLLIPGDLLGGVVAHARGELPNECCGVLAGRVEGGDGVVTARFPVGNDANSPTDYATNPRDLLTAFRAMREGGTELLAVYHSHPTSAPAPSQKDRVQNTYGTSVVHLIVGLAGDEPDVRGWWLGEPDVREAEVRVTPPG